MILKVKQQNSYGRERHYIVDDEKAKAYKRLSGHKTLHEKDLEAIETLTGTKIDVEVVNEF